VSEEKVCKIPYTTCRMVCEERTCVQKCQKCTMVTEDKVCKIPYTVCKTVAKEVVRQVPVTTCRMEPYCETYKVCRRVPICAPSCCEPGVSATPHESLSSPPAKVEKKEEE
jgi:hypothetical protein